MNYYHNDGGVRNTENNNIVNDPQFLIQFNIKELKICITNKLSKS